MTENILNIAAGRAINLANKLSTNSAELFTWRNRFLKAQGINIELESVSPNAPILKLSSKEQAFIFAGLIYALCSEKFSFEKALEMSLESLNLDNNVNNTKTLLLRTDGASRGNPGSASIGFVVWENGEIIYQKGEFIGKQTNNYAEYTALERGISYILLLNPTDIIIELDSELVVKQILGIYKVKDINLKKIHENITNKLNQFKGKWSIKHIRRDENSLADKLCNEALDRI